MFPEYIDDEISDEYELQLAIQRSEEARTPSFIIPLHRESTEALRQRIAELETLNAQLAETVRWYQDRASERFAELISDNDTVQPQGSRA